MGETELVGHLPEIVVLHVERAQMLHSANARAIDVLDLVAIEEEILENGQLIDAVGKLGEPILRQVELAQRREPADLIRDRANAVAAQVERRQAREGHHRPRQC